MGAAVPNPRTSQLEIVKEYRKDMDKYGYDYDVFSLEGYIGTSILIDAIKKIKGPVTREKIMQQLEGLKDYKFKGLTLTFDPKHRDLARHVWIETGDNVEWAQQDVTLGEKGETSKSTINGNNNTAKPAIQPSPPPAPPKPESGIDQSKQ